MDGEKCGVGCIINSVLYGALMLVAIVYFSTMVYQQWRIKKDLGI